MYVQFWYLTCAASTHISLSANFLKDFLDAAGFPSSCGKGEYSSVSVYIGKEGDRRARESEETVRHMPHFIPRDPPLYTYRR